jgi:hypothetical protein
VHSSQEPAELSLNAIRPGCRFDAHRRDLVNVQNLHRAGRADPALTSLPGWIKSRRGTPGAYHSGFNVRGDAVFVMSGEYWTGSPAGYFITSWRAVCLLNGEERPPLPGCAPVKNPVLHLSLQGNQLSPPARIQAGSAFRQSGLQVGVPNGSFNELTGCNQKRNFRYPATDHENEGSSALSHDGL